jgi:CRP-like cAMP-binding protein
VLRKIDVPFLNRKTKKIDKHMKQVVVGKLKETDSFGEISVAMKEPMTCSIVTETSCKMGVILSDNITRMFLYYYDDLNLISLLFIKLQFQELDNITIRLLLQTNNRTFFDLSEEDLQRTFIGQETKNEWKNYKNKVVNNVFDKYSIVHGTGKHNSC